MAKHFTENLRKWEQNPLHLQKKVMVFDLIHSASQAPSKREGAKKCRSGATLIKFRSLRQ
jgi:hypothetical protein